MDLKATKQMLFDRSFVGLRNQRFEQSADHGTCMYSGPNGLRCAVGQLISDAGERDFFDSLGSVRSCTATYDKDGVDTFLRASRFWKAIGLPDMVPDSQEAIHISHFLSGLQQTHDSAKCAGLAGSMEKDLVGFAHLHGLTVPA